MENIETRIREKVWNYIETKYTTIKAASLATGIAESTIGSIKGKQKNTPGSVFLYRLKKADPDLDLNQLLFSDELPHRSNAEETPTSAVSKGLVEVLMNSQKELLDSNKELIDTIRDAVKKR
jgi:hypothetical protein